MAEARARHDQYGRPLPTLVQPQAPRLPMSPEAEGNRLMREYVAGLLDTTYDLVLQPGVRAEIHLTLWVKDGRLQPEVDCGVTYQYRLKHGGGKA